MTTRRDLELHRKAQAEISKRVQAELASFVRSLALSDPAAIRDALLEVVPVLTAQYGDASAAIAAEWFEATYGARADLPAPMPREAVERGVRYAAGHLFAESPDLASTLSLLAGDLDKWVKQSGRDTVRISAASNRMAWARVPRGAKTCSWCLILASRGPVYESREAATRAGDGEGYHGHCDCQAIAVREGDDLPEGYDPESLYDTYQAARDAAGSGDIKDIAAAMRREFPDLVNDAAHDH